MGFFKKKKEIKEIYVPSGNSGCFATNRITVDGMKVGYMYREEPDPDSKLPDSGWRFFAGDDESNDYCDDPDNIQIFNLNTICNYDPLIIKYLNSPYGSAWIREGDKFVEDVIDLRK